MQSAPEEPDYASQPHDAFFKDVFSEPEHAIGFFKKHLPSAIAGKIDWPTLTVVPSSFVKTELQQVHSDLLFSVMIEGREMQLYLLFEHQTTVDPLMPLRLLGYLIEIFQRHHAQHGLPLPPVLPFVFHQGPSAWTASTEFSDLFDLPDELAAAFMPYLPQFSRLLLDLSQYDPTSDGNDERVRAILLLMKLARSRKVGRFFDWFGNSAAGAFSDSLLIRLLYYALHSEHKLDVQDIYRKLAHNPELRKKTMTIADKLIAQGLSRGVTQGELIGRIKSLQEFLDLALTSGELLRNKPIAELEEIRRELQKDYETRFKKVVKEADSGGSQ